MKNAGTTGVLCTCVRIECTGGTYLVIAAKCTPFPTSPWPQDACAHTMGSTNRPTDV